MLNEADNLKKIIQYCSLTFVVIFLGFILSGNLTYLLSGSYVENYLSIYTNTHDLLLQKEIPMWSFNFFLGGNFLGAQNVYSIFNPFFLITLFFSSNALPKLYFLLLFLKSILAALALYLYMKETAWFKPHTMIVAILLYLFNGWYLSNLSEFVTIELLIFVPLVLYGIEKMIGTGKKRYFVATTSLLLLSHFTFTVLSLWLIVAYIGIRYYFALYQDKKLFKSRLRKLAVALVLILGINMVLILPLTLAFNAVSIDLQEGITVSSFFTFLLRSLFPPFHRSFTRPFQLFSNDVNVIALYQSVLTVLVLPQFFRNISKKVRWVMGAAYGILLFVVFITQSLELVNVTSLAPLNTNVISIFLILFNSLMVAYGLNDLKSLNVKLLRKSGQLYQVVLLLLLGGGGIADLVCKYAGPSNWTISILLEELIILSPYFLAYLVISLLIKVYRYILSCLKFEKEGSDNLLIFFLILECVTVSYTYFSTDGDASRTVSKYMADETTISHKTYAIADYLQAVDNDFYRIINSYEIQANEPLYQSYNGFSIANPYLVLSSQDVEWMLDETTENRLSISPIDYMLTTALSAKYYLTPDYVNSLPGYEYYDRIEGITIFKNEYFLPIGTSSPYYMLNSEFQRLNREQQQYVFLSAIILEDENLALSYQLERLDVEEIPETISEIHYFEAARLRKSLGAYDVMFSSNRVKHQYDTTGPRLISYTIPYNKGWKAYVNGEEVPIYEINNGFIGVALEQAGNYQIELRYCTPGFLVGLSISVGTLLTIVLFFYNRYLQGRRNVPK